MADISQTTANVGLSTVSGNPFREVVYGEAVTEGMPVYQLASDSKHYQCDSNASAAAAVAVGIAMTPGATDDCGLIALPGAFIDLGATLVVGKMHYVSVTKGAIADAQPVTGGFNTSLGIAITASQLELKINVSGIDTP